MKRLRRKVNSLYNKPCTHCGGYHYNPLPSMADEGKLPAIYEDLLKRLHAGDIGNGDIDHATVMDVAGYLMQAVFTGFGKDFENLVFDTPDYNMLARLERDVYSFSAAKNYKMLKALTLELKEGNKIRSYAEFRREAAKVLDEWVGSWLRTEYDTAIASAQMAGKWGDFERDAAIIPLLEYQTVGDSRVREAHRLLNGVVKPVGDSFWNYYYPPNGWGCRCDVVQLNRGTITPDDKIEYPDMPDMFKTNMAKQGVIFPPGHPYYNGIPKDVLEKSILNLPVERQFERTYKNGNGSVWTHRLADIEASDFAQVHQVAIDKADKGHMVEIMPMIHVKETVARNTVFNGAKHGKNPDLRIDGNYWEVEGPKPPLNVGKISQRIRYGSHQADMVIISLPAKVNKGKMYKIAKGRFRTLSNLQTVEFELDGEYIRFDRSKVMKKK